jgi:hypothetical protein
MIERGIEWGGPRYATVLKARVEEDWARSVDPVAVEEAVGEAPTLTRWQSGRRRCGPDGRGEGDH